MSTAAVADQFQNHRRVWFSINHSALWTVELEFLEWKSNLSYWDDTKLHWSMLLGSRTKHVVLNYFRISLIYYICKKMIIIFLCVFKVNGQIPELKLARNIQSVSQAAMAGHWCLIDTLSSEWVTHNSWL